MLYDCGYVEKTTAGAKNVIFAMLVAAGGLCTGTGTVDKSTPAGFTDDLERSKVLEELVVPRPGDAKLDTEYFENVAMPFYAERIVDAYRPSPGVKRDVAERVRTVRRALARALATGRAEFPTHEEFEAAHRLWREKCRDAAVAILHSDGLSGDDRYWQSEKIYKEAISAFDFAADPFMGFLLRLKAMAAGHYRISRNDKVNRKPIREAEVACSNAFVQVAEVLRRADRRVPIRDTAPGGRHGRSRMSASGETRRETMSRWNAPRAAMSAPRSRLTSQNTGTSKACTRNGRSTRATSKGVRAMTSACAGTRSGWP